MRGEFKGRAAGAVAIDDKAMSLQLPRGGGGSLEHRPGLLQLVADLRVDPRPLGANAAERDPLRRQTLIGVVGSEREPKLGP